LISETILLNKLEYPRNKLHNYKELLALNPTKYKKLHLKNKYLLLKELQKRLIILNNISPKNRKDFNGVKHK